MAQTLFKSEEERQKVLAIYAKQEKNEKLSFQERQVLNIYQKRFSKSQKK